MRKNILKLTIFVLNIFFVFGAVGFSPIAIAAEKNRQPYYNIMANGGGATFGDRAGYTAVADPTASIAQKIASVISIALSFLGVIFLVLMIYAGYLWMTASGNETRIKDAQKIMKNAIIGLVIVVMAYMITAFVGRVLAPTTTGV